MATKGDWGRWFANGYEGTSETNNLTPNEVLNANPVAVQNTGLAQFAPGVRMDRFNNNGYRKAQQNPTLHQLLAQNVNGVGFANDTEYVVSVLLGHRASPAAGDMAFLFDGRCMDYQDRAQPGNQITYQAQFMPWGNKRGGFGNLIIDQPATTTGTITSAFFDRGANSVGLNLGAVAILQCYTPSGIQATGTITFGAIPADGDTVVINGTTYTFKTALTPTAGQVLIGATAAATALNLFQAMIGSQTGKGTNYASGTTTVPNTGTSGIIVSKPSSTVINLTAAVAGTGGNALTLTSAGGANKPTVSGAGTLTGGTAGDSYVVTVQTATTSGGSYTTRGTFASTLQTIGGERIEIAVGTTLDRFVKVLATTGGSTSKPAFNVCFRSYFQQ